MWEAQLTKGSLWMLYFFLIFGIAIITRVMTSLAQRCTRDWIKHFDGREDSTERDIIDRITRLKRDYIDRYKRRVLFGISALWVTVTMLSLFRKNLDRLEVNVYYLMILSIFIFVFSIKSIRKKWEHKGYHGKSHGATGARNWRLRWYKGRWRSQLRWLYQGLFLHRPRWQRRGQVH